MHPFSFRNTAPALLLALATFSPNLQASAVTVPSGLLPGENYRIIFGTSTLTTASSGNINYYNSFVTDAAQLDTGLAALSTTWVLLGSTPQVNVFENASLSSNDTATKFFNTRGELIAIGVNALYGGNLTHHFSPIYTESGNDVMDTLGNRLVWTGTFDDGRSPFPFGNDGTIYGIPNSIGNAWTGANILNSNVFLPVYGISGVLSASEVPEPGTLLLTALSLAALRRRSSTTARKHP